MFLPMPGVLRFSDPDSPVEPAVSRALGHELHELRHLTNPEA
jgi:hypothetical protein